MKPVFYVFALSVCLLSCRKGKTLPHVVNVQFITVNESNVYPKDHFPLSDPNNWTETPKYPNYADSDDSVEIADEFNKDLSRFLEKNNIHLQTDTADYVLRIEFLNLSESLQCESYIDSCSSGYPERCKDYSSLKFKAKATLYRNGIKIDSWTKEANSRETVRLKTDRCNEPKTFPIIRGTYWLVEQVAKELRVRISKKMYKLET